MMHVETVILGATFAAAGLLQVCDDCVVLERRPQAGYEFLNTMRIGTGYDRNPVHTETRTFLEQCREKGALESKVVSLPRCTSTFYGCLQEKQVLLNMDLVSLEKTQTGWIVTAYGVSGFRTWKANRIVDTRVHPWMTASKTINILVDGKEKLLPPGIPLERYGTESWVLKCPVPVETDYVTARKIAMDVIEELPEECKVIHVADTFDTMVQGEYPMEKDGIAYLPSCAWDNPFLAFDAGVMYGKEHK